MLKNKVGIITGASTGIGRACALLWAQEGAKLVLADLNETEGSITTKMVNDAGGEAIFVKCDVGSAQDNAELVTCIKHFGKLNIACNNAGIGGGASSVAEKEIEDWDNVIRINLSGVFYGCKYQISAMLKNGGGSIINMASILGSVGFAGASAYVAAKHGVVGLTKTAALDHSVQGIRVNAIGPAFIRTPMIEHLEADPAVKANLIAAHAIGRLGEPKEIAELATWLASDKSSFVTGAYYPVDGGYLSR